MSRRYRGSKRYVEVYNRETREFFLDASKLRQSYSNTTLHLSYVTNQYTMVYNKKGYGDGTPTEEGIFWSAGEKELFFRLLSRYGMSRLDDMVEGMGGLKGRLEIIQYYTTLKKETAYMKRRQRLGRRKRALLRMSDIPIAYEMSESFITMEEAQAHLIIAYEANKISDETRRLKLLLPDVGGPEFLLDENACLQLSQLYRKNIRLSQGRAPKLTAKTLLFLADLARCYTTQLLIALTTNKVEEACQKNLFLSVKNKSEIFVSRADVHQAIKLVSGTRYTLNNYFRHLHLLFSFDAPLETTLKHTISFKNVIQPFTYSDKEKWAEYEALVLKQREGSESSIHISQLVCNDDTIEFLEDQDTAFSFSDPEEDSPNDATTTAEVDREDMLNSRIHEHALLSYFAGEWGNQLLEEVDEEMRATNESEDLDSDAFELAGDIFDRTESDAMSESEIENGHATVNQNGLSTSTSHIDPNLIGIKDAVVARRELPAFVLQFLSTLESELESDSELHQFSKHAKPKTTPSNEASSLGPEIEFADAQDSFDRGLSES